MSDKIEFIITDNASNMKSAIKAAIAEYSDESEDEDMVGEPRDEDFPQGYRQRLSCFAQSSVSSG